MRILITKKGEVEVKTIEHSRNQRQKNKRNYSFNMSKSSFGTKSEWNKNDSNYLSKTNSHFPTIKPSYVDINESKITNKILNQATNITLKKPKLLIDKQSKNLLKQYQEATTPAVNFQNSKRLSVSNLRNSLSNNQSQSTIQLKTILSPEAINSLKKEIISKEESIIQQKKKSEEEFRTVYSQWNNKIDEFENMLTKEIKTDKNNLINYFSQKNDMSIVSFNHLCCSNNDQIIKMNKICQIIQDNQEEREKVKEKIREKLIRKKDNLKLNSRKSVDGLMSELNQTKIILNKYNPPPHIKNQYKVLLEDMRRVYWSKNNADRLTRKSNKRNELTK